MRNVYKSLLYKLYRALFESPLCIRILFICSILQSFTTNTLNDPGTIFLLAVAALPGATGSISAAGKNKV